MRAPRLLAIPTTLVLAAALAVVVSPPARAATLQKKASRPVQLTVFSPRADDVAGREGSGFVVDLSLTARNEAANSFLSPDAGYKPVFNNPTAPTFQPGANAGAPGLVVLLSTTPDTPGTAFHGPNTNLAGLFQINGVGSVRGGLTQTWNTWQIGRAGFGSGASTLTAYVVKGTAPAVVPESGLEVISNKVTVPFTITTPATPPATPAATATLKVANDPGLGDLLVDASGRTLYLFERDQGAVSACTGACVATWPPSMSVAPIAGPGVDAGKIGNANGQLMYAGHLLYTYAGDSKPGDTNGAGIPNWAAISPSGTPLRTR